MLIIYIYIYIYYCNKMVEAISYRNEIVVGINKNQFMYNFIATK